MNESAQAPKKKRAGRSPGYPAIDVQTALRRSQELYDNAQQHYSHIHSVARHWGYKPGSGMAATTIAALIKYGFLIAEGSGQDRRVRLTELALDIIKDNRVDSIDRNRNLTKAAFSPEIHNDMHEMYGDNLPSDADLLYELERNRGFTPKGAKEFLGQYKNTLEYVCDLLPDGDKTNLQENVSEQQEESSIAGDVHGQRDSSPAPEVPVTPNKNANVQTITIPMLEGVWPTLTAQFPMTKEDWDYMMKVLEAMEPKLVKEESKYQEVDIDQKLNSA